MTTRQNSRLVVEDTAVMAGRTSTEIDPEDRVVRKTWKMMGFTRSRTFELDSNAVVQIKADGTVLEGYSFNSYRVYLTVRGGKIRIFSTDDLEEARLIQIEVTEFLKQTGEKCPIHDYLCTGNV